jgi:hypothetical protein
MVMGGLLINEFVQILTKHISIAKLHVDNFQGIIVAEKDIWDANSSQWACKVYDAYLFYHDLSFTLSLLRTSSKYLIIHF